MKLSKLELPPLVRIFNQLLLEDALKFNFITQNMYNQFCNIETSSEVTLMDGKTYPVLLKNGEIIIDGVPYPASFPINIKNSSGMTYLEVLHILTRNFNVSAFVMQVLLDSLAVDTIDSRLAPIFELYKKLSLDNDYRQIWLHINRCREAEIHISKLNDNVRACYNGINWSYGDVVVLCGNREHQISYSHTVRNDYEAKFVKLADIKLTPRQEIGLLQPFENGGEFFSLDLVHPDTIVIGPQAILSQYKNSAARMFFIEDMTSEQLAFFNVPTELKHRVLNDSPLDKIGHFSYGKHS